jgi:hypothetical protein
MIWVKINEYHYELRSQEGARLGGCKAHYGKLQPSITWFWVYYRDDLSAEHWGNAQPTLALAAAGLVDHVKIISL